MINWKIKAFAEFGIDDLFEVMKLRQEIFIVEQKCLYNDIDVLDRTALHLIGHALSGHTAKEICVYARIIAPTDKCIEAAIGRVIVHPVYRGRGYGVVLMKKALEITTNQFPTCAVRISAQAHLEGFYRAIGFEKVSEPYDEDGIPHLDMRKLS